MKCTNESVDCVYDSVITLSEQLLEVDVNSTEKTWTYGGEIFHYFSTLYEPVHLPLSFVICLLGVAANASNVIVLTRKTMITPTNVVLTGLSAAQLFLLVNYLLLLAFNMCANNCILPVLHSYTAMTYKWINVNVSVAFHTVALCHTLVLAIFRFLAIKAPAFTRANLNARAARLSVLVLHLAVPLLCAPTFFTSYVARVAIRSPRDHCGYPEPYDLDYADAHLIEVAMWEFGIFFKLIPSVMIVVLSFYLIISLKKYNDKKDRLTGKKDYEEPTTKGANSTRQLISQRPNWKNCETPGSPQKQGALNSPPKEEPSRSAKRKSARSTLTKMLVAVSLLCASVEFPHGIVNLLTAFFGQEFGMEVYDNLGDLFEMLTLLYSSVNFVLYCAMSTEFQRTFRQLFCVPIREALVYRLLRRPVPIQKNDTTVLYKSSYMETAY